MPLFPGYGFCERVPEATAFYFALMHHEEKTNRRGLCGVADTVGDGMRNTSLDGAGTAHARCADLGGFYRYRVE